VPTKKSKKSASSTTASVFCSFLAAYVLFFISFYLGVPQAANSLVFSAAGGAAALAAIAKAGAFFILYCIALSLVMWRHGLKWALASAALFLLIAFLSFFTMLIQLAGAAVIFFLAAFYWHLYSGKTLAQSADSLGLRKQGWLKEALIGIPVLFGILALVLAIGLASLFTGVSDQQKVQQRIAALPDYVVFIGFMLAPFGEELLFRGLLMGLVGPVVSSAAFALLHFGYGSLVEIVAAFAIGVFLCFVVKWRKGNIIAALVGHALYNLGSLIAMKYLM
jgi:membrane protease YdiL (CAAX protease family)